MARLFRGVLGSALVTCVVFVSAAQPVAQKPSIKVGDSWEFTGKSEPEGKPNDWTRTVVELAPNDAFKVRWHDGRVYDYDSLMNFMPEGRVDYARVLVRYPLKVGDEWEMSRKFPNPSTTETGKARVAAFETITVPAGSFQCYRVEAETGLISGRYHENRSWKRWYCPDVKWIAKEVLETKIHKSGGQTASVVTSELVKFTPGN